MNRPPKGWRLKSSYTTTKEDCLSEYGSLFVADKPQDHCIYLDPSVQG